MTTPTATERAQQEVTYLEAISQALDEEMSRDERVFLMGEDIGPYGGAFRITEGFQKKYGEWRVLDTPLAESGHLLRAQVFVPAAESGSPDGRLYRAHRQGGHQAPGRGYLGDHVRRHGASGAGGGRAAGEGGRGLGSPRSSHAYSTR